MAINVYEGMFIFDSTRYGRNPESVVNQIPKMIEDAQGELLVSRLWEERRLAYPIDGQRKGTYWLTYFRADGKEIAPLERKCQLSDTIIRVLFLKVDPRIADALIEHAQVKPFVSEKPVSEPAEGDDEEDVVVDAIDDIDDVDDIDVEV